MENNVENTTRIQKICHYNNIPLLYASSSCIHNWWLSPYGTSKKVNEETAFNNQVGLRFTTVYGDGARESMLIGKLLDGSIAFIHQEYILLTEQLQNKEKILNLVINTYGDLHWSYNGIPN